MPRLRWLPLAWSALLAALMLWPALGLGYVLSYDMVWVPDLAMRTDFLGLGSGLPRAVPSDAVVAVLDEVVPGMLLQKLMLAGSLIGGGLGAARLAPPTSLVGKLAAVSVYQWNPFVAERLLIGHWPVLLCYAALPWIVLAGRRVRQEGRVPVGLWWLMPLASLSASAGLIAAITLLAFSARRGATRAMGTVVALVVAVNLPWLAAGILHAGDATTDGGGARAFALGDEGMLPGPVAALGLGGIWNGEVVLSSREGMLAWVSLVVVATLAALGARAWWQAVGTRDALAFLGCWGIGFGAAVLTWTAPDQIAWLVAEVPGAGLMRDGSRMLALCAPLVAGLVAYGAAAACRLVPQPVPAASVGVALVLFPLAVMPDAAFGLGGRLGVASYPGSYAETRDAVAAQDAAQPGHDVLVLPFTSYRAPDWNRGGKVLDPLGRYLTPNYVASDELVVSGRTIAGEDPRGERVREALAESGPEQRARALAAEGIGIVVTEVDGLAAPPIAGTQIDASGDLRVLRLDVPVRGTAPTATWVAVLGLAWFCYLGVLGAGVLKLTRQLLRKASRTGAH